MELLAYLPAAEDTESAAMDALATADALEMIAGLPAVQAEAVLLTVVMGLDSKAAGKVAGKRPGAVWVAAHRGLRPLAEQLTAVPTPAADADTAGQAAHGQAAHGKVRRRVTAWQDVTVKDLG